MYNEYVRVYIHFYYWKKYDLLQSIKEKEDVIQINNEIEKYE